MASIPQLHQQFVKILQSFGHSRDPRKVFGDWLEIAALTLHQAPYHSGDFAPDESFATIEAKYLEAVKPYTREELEAMGKMLSLTLAAYQQEFGDFLGKIAAEQELLNQNAGQFFTPYEVCRMMAQMTLGDARSIVEQQGMITISEPASGGGAMVIACAEALHHQGIDPRSVAQFDCIDVSRNAFNMTYIQLSALDLQAIVRHGNTLSLEMWESRPTPGWRYFDQWLREQQAIAQMERLGLFFTDPEAFFAEEAAANPPESAVEPAVEPGAIVPAPAEPEPTPKAPASTPTEQLSLFDWTADANSATSPKTRRKADITLPENRQLDLFGNGNQMD